MSTSPPKTILLLLEQISKLQSRKAVYSTLISHLRICYRKSDSGAAEMRVTREDLATVPERHIEETIIEIEERIDVINAELEELQNQPFGGGAPPQAEVTVPAAAPAAEAEQEKKGTPSGKPRSQSPRSS